MKKIIFVYNVNSGVFNSLKDSVRKTVKPSSYPCNLCGLTWNTFSEKKEWKKFILSLDKNIVFLHKNEFEKLFNEKNFKLPAVFKTKNNSLVLLINSREINKCKTLKDLTELVKKKI